VRRYPVRAAGLLVGGNKVPDDPIDQAKEDLGVARDAIADAHRQLEELAEPAASSGDQGTERSGVIDLSGGGGPSGGGTTDD